MNKSLHCLLPLGLLLAANSSHASFETLTHAGSPVLLLCEGTEANRNPTVGVCRVSGDFPTPSNGVTTFPGLAGSNWAVYATNNNQAVIANGTRVGNIDDRIWRRGTTTEYVFGMRLQMENRQWTPPSPPCASTTPDFFEVNDMFRNGFNSISNVGIAYRLGNADEGAWFSGRTFQGLNQYPNSPEGRNPARNNDVIDFRTDVNIDDPDAESTANSSWMYVHVTLPTPPSASTPAANAIVLREGGEEGQCQFSIQLNGWRP